MHWSYRSLTLSHRFVLYCIDAYLLSYAQFFGFDFSSQIWADLGPTSPETYFVTIEYQSWHNVKQNIQLFTNLKNLEKKIWIYIVLLIKVIIGQDNGLAPKRCQPII